MKKFIYIGSLVILFSSCDGGGIFPKKCYTCSIEYKTIVGPASSTKTTQEVCGKSDRDKLLKQNGTITSSTTGSVTVRVQTIVSCN